MNQIDLKGRMAVITGGAQGIGYAIVSAIGRARPSEVWTYVALITIVSIVLYNLVALLEESVLAKFGHSKSR